MKVFTRLGTNHFSAGVLLFPFLLKRLESAADADSQVPLSLPTSPP